MKLHFNRLEGRQSPNNCRSRQMREGPEGEEGKKFTTEMRPRVRL